MISTQYLKNQTTRREFVLEMDDESLVIHLMGTDDLDFQTTYPSFAAMAKDYNARVIDAYHVRDRDILGATDHELLERAYQEDRVLVTSNVGDFEKLAQARELHAGIVLIERAGLLRDEQIELIRQIAAALVEHGLMINEVLRARSRCARVRRVCVDDARPAAVRRRAPRPVRELRARTQRPPALPHMPFLQGSAKLVSRRREQRCWSCGRMRPNGRSRNATRPSRSGQRESKVTGEPLQADQSRPLRRVRLLDFAVWRRPREALRRSPI